MAEYKNRNGGITGASVYRPFGFLRFILALLVVISHSWGLSYYNPQSHFAPSLGIGNVSVVTFFVLSGFIIYEAVDVFYKNRPWRFLANRFIRLAPPYWAAFVLSFVTHWLLIEVYGAIRLPDYTSTPVGLFSLQTLLVNITAIIPIFNFNNVFGDREYYYFVRFGWAVFFEFIFYLSVFLVGVALTQRKLLGKLKMPSAIVGYSAVAIALIVHMVNDYWISLNDAFSFVPYFVFGIFLYHLGKNDRPIIIFGGAVVFGLIFLQFSRYTQGKIELSAEWWAGLQKPHVYIPVLLTLSLPWLIYDLSRTVVHERVRRVDRWFGDLSYPLYLNHYAVLVAFYTFSNAKGWVYQVSAICIAVALSWLMKVLIETPLRSLRNTLRGTSL